jgi:hypothetical protein
MGLKRIVASLQPRALLADAFALLYGDVIGEIQ